MVIPAFPRVFQGFGAELPLMTRLLLGFSNFTVANWPYIIGGAFLAFYGFNYWTNTKKGRYDWDRIKLRIPIAGKIIEKATLARFAPNDGIVFQACDDPGDAHYDELRAMASELAALRTRSNRPYRLFPLPWARPIVDDGRRLAASYANYLIINGAVLMPAYGDPADAVAQAVLAEAHPGREIVPVPCRPLIWQNGSLHCITMQLPAGVLA